MTPYTNAIEGFEPYHLDRVFGIHENGRNIYRVQNRDGTIRNNDQDDMLHFPGIGFDGLRSITPIRAALRLPGASPWQPTDHAGALFSAMVPVPTLPLRHQAN